MSSKKVLGKSEPRISEGSALEKVAKGPKVVVRSEKRIPAETLCGIQPKMGEAEVGARLKLLYRRYNRGASSLDAKMRAESETMLDAIVEVREKFFGEI